MIKLKLSNREVHRLCQHRANGIATRLISRGASLTQKGKHGSWYGTVPTVGKIRISDHHPHRKGFAQNIVIDNLEVRHKIRRSRFWLTVYGLHYRTLNATGLLNCNKKLLVA